MNTFGKLAFGAAMVCMASAKDLLDSDNEGRRLQGAAASAFPRDWVPALSEADELAGLDYHEGTFTTKTASGRA